MSSGSVRTVFLRAPEYDYKLLLEAFGNDEAIRELIESHGYDAPPIATIRGWRSRNAIPSWWLVLLLGEAVEQGVIRNPHEALLKK